MGVAFGIFMDRGVFRVIVATLKGVEFGISRTITKRLGLTSGSSLGFRLRPHNRCDPEPRRDPQTRNTPKKSAFRHACSEEGSQGKGQNKGKSKSTTDKKSPANFEGECCHCGKKGHKWDDWQKRNTRKSSPSAATVAAVEDAGEVDEAGVCGSWSDDDDSGADVSEAKVLSVECNNMPADAEFLPFDSACEEHTCPWNFAEGGRDLGPSNVQLRNANGHSTPSGRKVMVSYKVVSPG